MECGFKYFVQHCVESARHLIVFGKQSESSTKTQVNGKYLIEIYILYLTTDIFLINVLFLADDESLYEKVLEHDDIKLIESEPYFRAVDRVRAEEILQSRVDGSCLLRPFKENVYRILKLLINLNNLKFSAARVHQIHSVGVFQWTVLPFLRATSP